MGMFSAALRRYAGFRALDDLKERLLYAFAGYIPCDRDILALFGDLIDLIDIDDTVLRPLHVIVSRLDQLQQDIFHILAHIAGFRQPRSQRAR